MRGGRGGRVAPLGVSRRRRKQEVAGVWPRAPATRSASFWREEDDDWQRQQAGPAQVRPGGLLLSFFCFLFLFSIKLQLFSFR